jgi:hypothetical protein
MSGIVDTSGWDLEDTGARRHGRPSDTGPGFLAAPFARRTWGESLQLILNLPVGAVSFSVVVTMMTAGIGTLITFLGLPVLAATLACSRGFGAMERSRAARLLQLDVTGPAPLRGGRPGLMGWVSASFKDGAGWRAALYSVLMLPFGVLSFTVTVTLWAVALPCASYPLWQWVFPTYVHRPGIELYENDNVTHYLSSVPEIAGCCALGVVLLFVTPQILRGLANVQRATVRGLLSR